MTNNNASVDAKGCELAYDNLVNLELDAQELEDMEAPGWDCVVSIVVSMIGGISIGVAIT